MGRPNADKLISGKQKGKKGNGGKAASSSAFGKEQLATVQGWLRGAEGYSLMPEGQALTAFATSWLPVLSALKQHVRVLQAGVTLAEAKGKDCVPAHALAMSSLLRREAFACEEVGGFVLLTYRDFPLGFVKNVGNRANNLYPQEWRIHSGYLPEEIRIL